jgi:plasmid stability protein
MEQTKRSIYLDNDVDAALKASAAANSRSVTKQLNLMLRNALGMEQMHRNVTLSFDQRPFRGPDPKVKARPAKKLT